VQPQDSCGAFRDAVLAIIVGVAKQERVRISERTRAGLDRAREENTDWASDRQTV
jgi:DNA invertase Pin-like site-specific DNA recombinase